MANGAVMSALPQGWVAAAVRLLSSDACVKVYANSEEEEGFAFLWEQQYWQHLTHPGPDPPNWKDQRGREKRFKTVERLCEEWGFDGGDFTPGSSSRAAGEARWARLSTRFLVAWLLHRLEVP